MATKTVFTADVVTYDFLPEKYAEEQTLVTAELNINILCNWQQAIDEWYHGDVIGNSKALPVKVQDLLTKAQGVHFMQTIRGVVPGQGIEKQVGSKDPTAMSDEQARDAVQSCLYHMVSKAKYWESSGVGQSTTQQDGDKEITTKGDTISSQFKKALTALLLASKYDDTGGDNALEIAGDKVDTDLGIGTNPMPLSTISVTDMATSKLMSLVNGYAFVPVLNRLIAGGSFSKGKIDGGADAADATGLVDPGEWEKSAVYFDLVMGTRVTHTREEYNDAVATHAAKVEEYNKAAMGLYHFDHGETFDGSNDQIHAESQIVFPIKILMADDKVTLMQTAQGETAGQMLFQLNLIFTDGGENEDVVRD